MSGHHHQSICRKFASKTPDYSSDSSGLNYQNLTEVQNSTLVSYTSEPIANEIPRETNTEEENSILGEHCNRDVDRQDHGQHFSSNYDNHRD